MTKQSFIQGLNPESTIWLDAPANSYNAALPVGNGRLGLMPFGGISKETIIINEESMWSGSANDDLRKDAHKNLQEIRNLLLAGKNKEAQKLVMDTFTGPSGGPGGDKSFGCYQVMGTLSLAGLHDQDSAQDYYRYLDLSTGVTEMSYTVDKVRFKREFFVSKPKQLCAIRLTADRAGAISFALELTRPERAATQALGNELIMTGQLNDGCEGDTGVRYCTRIRVLPEGGSLSSSANTLAVEKADSVLIIIAADTDYDGAIIRDRKVCDPIAMTKKTIDAATGVDYYALLTEHKAEHLSLYQSSTLSLHSNKDTSRLPTNERLIAFAEEPADLALCVLYYNFGRYLLMGSSRPGDLPANLQGIWADEIQTPWNGDWHLDINVQMNYWPAEICNMSELHVPMLKLIESQKNSGTKTALAYYNAPGWVSHVITNCWGYTAPGSNASWGSTTIGSAWLCEHLWEHYLFTRDKEYLKWAYPILKGSAEFYANFLITDPGTGWKVTAPSNSPENAFVTPEGDVLSTCMGPTMDMQILRELFGNCIAASQVLDIDQDFRGELCEHRALLAPNQIGPDGRLQEWMEPYEEKDPKHRHISHLYGLHPYNEITPDTTPELAEAARKSLELRGDGSTGWSMAWKVNFWARLFDGDRAYKLLKNLLKPSGCGKEIIMGKHGGGTSPNLFCQHPPFQIDGNLGGTAAIAEMLLQSRWTGNEGDAAKLLLLPALPSAWQAGTVTGLKARGDIQVDLKWKDSKLIEASLWSSVPQAISVSYGGNTADLTLDSASAFKLKGKHWKRCSR